MIALYDTNNTLAPKIQRKLENEDINRINSLDELLNLLKNDLNQYSKVLINTSLIEDYDINKKVVPLVDSSSKQSKVLFYELNSSIASITNNKIFKSTTSRNPSKKEESLSNVLDKLKGITGGRTGSKYKHIVIGVSTGGPSTLEKVIPLFPKDIDVSIVVIQHILRGNYIYKICERLNSISQLEVKVAEQGEVLKKGTVYFPPPGVHLSYKKEINGDVSIILTPDYQKRGHSQLFNEEQKFIHIPSVDIGIESASDIYKEQMIGVILTGMGSDGAIALKYARDNGAYTFSEAESTSIIYGMPKVAFEKGGSMEVLKHYLIPGRILEIINYKKD